MTAVVPAIADGHTDTHVDILPLGTVTIGLRCLGTKAGVADGELPKPGYSQALRTELASMFSVDVEQVRIQSIEDHPYTPESGFTYSVTIAILPTVLGESLPADDVSEAFETARSSTGTLTIAEHEVFQIESVDVVAPSEQQEPPAPPLATTPPAAEFLGNYSLAVKAASHHFVRGCFLSSVWCVAYQIGGAVGGAVLLLVLNKLCGKKKPKYKLGADKGSIYDNATSGAEQIGDSDL